MTKTKRKKGENPKKKTRTKRGGKLENKKNK